MNIVGYVDNSGARCIAARDGDLLVPLGSMNHFWSDPHAAVANAGNISQRIDSATTTLSHPVPDSARVLCLGLNYRAHAAEGKFDPPEHPMIFGRWTASLVTDGSPVTVPVDELGLDWEAEVAAVVGASICVADAETARAAVFGYAAFNDLSARRAQKLTTQWTLGKNADSSGPIGDLVTADEVGDLRDGLRVRTLVNGTVMQDGNTRDMIFELGEVLALVSRTMTLNPGDVIVTGTPEGVGYARNPPILLNAGDEVTIDIERVGTVTTPIVNRT
ncbi:MAG: 2-keto-4-pentenoate hydratase/2-oxohepta-3-ene-1,7-dioic acid hydratase in catechol pathway [Pontimonas sp.]|jgi:2-keto-4-pentenoate hydratase/2-oxohepta-3-ene-1,7-dioic acid hydratase in catechol pathway